MTADMDALIYLTHRIPYPPNKGDKLTTFHLLRHLSRSFRVYLGTIVDDPADWQHTGTVRAMCADVCFVRIDKRVAALRSLTGFATGDALNVPFHRHKKLARWVRATIDAHAVGKAVIYGVPMAQYLLGLNDVTRIAHLADVDSQKWTRYGEMRRWPLSSVYRREGRRLLDFERRVAVEFDRSFLVTPAEANLFRELAPESADKVAVLANGVDAEYFSADAARPSPFDGESIPIVFTGAMDYWPNAEAVSWFADNVFPRVRSQAPRARFYIVGMNPTPAVRRLGERAGIVVTGTVPDVRPYMQHAALVVAPLRLARGIQNKVLEAMAMAKAVVASKQCAASLSAVPGHDIEIADSADEFVAKVSALLHGGASELGKAARQRIVSDYNWDRNLAAIDAALIERRSRADAADVRTAFIASGENEADATRARISA